MSDPFDSLKKTHVLLTLRDIEKFSATFNTFNYDFPIEDFFDSFKEYLLKEYNIDREYFESQLEIQKSFIKMTES